MIEGGEKMALPVDAYEFLVSSLVDWVHNMLENPTISGGEAGEMLYCQGYYAYTQYYESTSANYEYVPITAQWYSLDSANTVLMSKYVNITSSVHVEPYITSSGSVMYHFPAGDGYWTITPGTQWADTGLTWSSSGNHTTNGDMYFISGTSGYYYGFGWAQGWSPSANFSFGSQSVSDLVTVTNMRFPNGSLPESTGGNTVIPLTVDPTETYNETDLLNVIESDLIECSELSSEQVVEIMINLYEVVQDETESESEPETETETSSCCSCACGDTTIYVNADGSLTLQNDVSGNFDLAINNDADLALNVNAAAGAFGAGAIVVDPDAEINITAGAGAFGAGAFGAGAIVAPNVDVNGSLDVGDISGEVNLNASDVSFELSAGDVNIDQSGATNNNTYNTTNNTTNNYYGTTEPLEIDYDEILSEDELESILSQETYEIPEIESISETILIDVEDLVIEDDTEYKEILEFIPDSLAVGMDLLNGLNVSAPLTSAAIISALWKIIKGR